MKHLDESNKILTLIKDFYTVTGQRIGVFDSNFNILVEYPKRCCALCEQIRNSADGFNACMESDRILLKEASKGKAVRHRCHAGLIDVCAPIVDSMGIVGYLMFGQILYDDDIETQLTETRKLTSKYVKDFDKTISSVRILTNEYLESVENIMTACISYIHLNKMLSATKEGLWAQIYYYIERNYTLQFSLKDMADELGFCISSICKTAKSHSGKTIHQLLSAKRINKAKELLENTTLNINEIASAVGINDYNYFTKLFRISENCTPSNFRKNLNKKHIKDK